MIGVMTAPDPTRARDGSSDGTVRSGSAPEDRGRAGSARREFGAHLAAEGAGSGSLSTARRTGRYSGADVARLDRGEQRHGFHHLTAGQGNHRDAEGQQGRDGGAGLEIDGGRRAVTSAAVSNPTPVKLAAAGPPGPARPWSTRGPDRKNASGSLRSPKRSSSKRRSTQCSTRSGTRPGEHLQ